MIKILSSQDMQLTRKVGEFMVRVRQKRRHMKLKFEALNTAVLTRGFACRRAAWRFKKRFACRHGVLFIHAPTHGCKCMSIDESSDADWESARFMPALDHDLKSIVAVPFQLESYRKLNELQHLSRTYGW